jgi:hypothetical protein
MIILALGVIETWSSKDSEDNLLLFILEGAYHGPIADFLTAIGRLFYALSSIGWFQASIRGIGVYQLGWLDAMLYSNSNGLYKLEQRLEIRHSFELHSSKLSFSALDIC